MNPRTVIGCVCSALAFFVGVQVASASPPPGVIWATSANGTGYDSGMSISALSDGSSIVTGQFVGTATFGSTPLTDAGSGDVFAAKMDADGTWAWATRAGGTGGDIGNGISALADGSSIVTGVFASRTATFGSTTPLVNVGNYDVFTAKMNADGTWAWATRAGGTGNDQCLGISTLADGSSIVTGYFTGTATFGSTTPLVSAGGSDVFTAKMNADGTWAWATRAGGTTDDQAQAISALSDGSSIVTGHFIGTATFGSTTPVTSAGSYDVFTAKMNADGTWAWATRAGGTGNDFGESISALPDGSSIVTGSFRATPAFGHSILSNQGVDDAFTAKMNADGSWAWATGAGGTGYDYGFGISALPDGSSVVTGYFTGIAAFGSTTLTSAGGNDAFTAKMNADGSWASATKAGGTSDDQGVGIAALPDGSPIVIGEFRGTATFGSTTPLVSGGSKDVFIARYLYAPQAPPVPTAVAGDGSAAVAITPVTGESVTSYTVTSDPDGMTCTVVAPLTGCTVEGLTNGTSYTFTATATNGGGTSDLSSASGAATPQPPAPNTPATPTAVAGNAQATVTVAQGSGGGGTPATFTVTAVEDNAKVCTVTGASGSCDVTGLTNGTSYTFTATATNGGGTGPASEGSSAVTPAAIPAATPDTTPATAFEASPALAPLDTPITQATRVAVTGKVHCVATTCVTTGSVPAGATRITQRATSRPAGHSAAGTCTVRRVRSKRTYSCTVHLSRGAWVITTTARTQSSAMAHFSKRVQVAPRKAAVTG